MTPPTYRALLINEVILNVAAHVEADKDLASLARVSRSFSGPALDILWSNLDSFIPLLECLPSDLVGQVIKSHIVTYTLKRPFTTADWHTFTKYARRIVTLGWPTWSRTTSLINRRVKLKPVINTSLLVVLGAPPASRPFPRLRRLTWTASIPQTIYPMLRTLLSPSITHLTVSVGFSPSSSESVTLSLVTMLGDVCPSMQHLAWTSITFLSDHIGCTFSSAACAWKNLVSLTCPALHPAALLQLSSSRCLRKLSTTLSHPFSVTSTAVDFPTFPALTELCLNTPLHSSLDTIANFLNKVTMSPSSLSFSAETTTELAVTKLLTAVAERCDQNALASLNVTDGGMLSSHPTANTPLTYTTIRPILRFRNLAHLDIDTHRTILLDDNALLEVANAFPRLKTFKINKSCGWQTRSQVTLHGMGELVARLASLRALALAVDAETQPLSEDTLKSATDKAIARIIRATSAGFSLDLLDSRIALRSTLVVAAFLSDLLPNIGDVLSWNLTQSDYNDTEEQDRGWSNVQKAIPIMRQVRRQEKAKWTKNPEL